MQSIVAPCPSLKEPSIAAKGQSIPPHIQNIQMPARFTLQHKTRIQTSLKWMIIVWYCVLGLCTAPLWSQLPAPTGLLFFPANGSTASELYLQWNRVVAPNETYEVQIATDAAFSQNMRSLMFPNAGTPIVNLRNINGLLPYTTYFARIRAISNMGTTGTFSIVTQGTTRAVGPEWLPVSNYDSGKSITLNWLPVTNATSYVLHVFAVGLQYSTFSGISTTSFTFNNALPQTQYNYNINAVMPNGSLSTAPSQRAFILPPSKPIPVMVSAISTTTVTVQWKPIIGASNVVIQISPSMTFNQVGPSKNVGLNDTVTTFSNINLVHGTTYYLRILASNNGIPINTVLSSPISFVTPAAAISLSSSTATHNAEASSGSFTVNSNVSWTATPSAAGLISFTPASGNGQNNVIQYSIPTNFLFTPRTMSINVSGGGITRTFSVIQAASTASLNVMPSALTLPAAGIINSPLISVQASPLLLTNAVSTQSWLFISPTSGNGNRTISVSASVNTSTATRTALVIVNATAPGVIGLIDTVVVTQAGTTAIVQPPQVNSLVLTSSSANVNADSSFVTFNVVSNVPWTASGNVPWMKLYPTSGTNNGTIGIGISPNMIFAPRGGQITVTGGGFTRTFNVAQSPSTATLIAVPATLNVPAAGVVNAPIINIQASGGLLNYATSNQPWLSVSPTSGNGNRTLQINTAPNPTTTARTALVIVNGFIYADTVVVTQAGTTATTQVNTLTLSTTTASVGADSSYVSFGISSNIAWTISSNVFWLKPTPTSGINNGTVGISVLPNPITLPRAGMITISGGGITRTFTVFQAETTPTYTIAAPQGVIATATMQNNFSVEWQPVQGATGYEIQHATNMNFTDNFITLIVNNPATLASSTPSWAVTASPGRTFYVRMRTIGTNGQRSEFSNVDTASTPPAIPFITGAATDITQTSFRVNWNAAQGATSYIFQLASDNQFTQQSIIRTWTDIQSLNLVVTNQQLSSNLIPGNTYFYRMSSVSAAGVISAFSYPASVLIPSSPLVAPIGLSFSSVTKTSFIANWQAVQGAIGYEVQTSPSQTFGTGIQTFTVSGGLTTNVIIGNLTAGTSRFVRVRTIGPNNTLTAFSPALMVSTLPATAPIALPPTNIGVNSFTAHWIASPDVPVTVLEIQTDNIVSYQYQTTSTSQTISNLRAGAVYFYRVRPATNGIPVGISSPWIRVELLSPTPGVLATPVMYQPTNVSTFSALIRWSPVSGATGYEIQVANSTAFTNILRTYTFSFQVSMQPVLQIDPLPTGQLSYVRVRAMGPNNAQTPYSNIVTVSILPATPISLAASNPTAVNFTANWQAAQGAARYIVEAAQDPQFTQGLVRGSTNGATSYTFTVPAGKTYFYRVLSQSVAYAQSPWSLIQTVTLPTGAINSLIAFDVVNPTTTSFTAQWQAVAGAASYTVQVSRTPDFSPALFVRTFNVTDTQVLVTGLQAGAIYFYRVTANATLALKGNTSLTQNDASSNIVSVILPADVPTALAATNLNQQDFTARWEEVSEDVQYIVQVSNTSSFDEIVTTINTEGNVTSVVVNVPQGGQYFYRVQTVSRTGTLSRPSNIIPVTLLTTSVRSTNNVNNRNMQVYPNPAPRGQMNALQCSLKTQGQVTVRVIDILGKEISAINHGYKTAGQHSLNLAQDLNLATGMYMIRLEVDGEVIGSTSVLVRE